MASVKELYRAGLLSAKRLKGSGFTGVVTLTYAESIKNRDGDEKTKLIIELDDGEFRLPLNKTQATTLSKAWGDESDEWVGKKVKVTKGKTNFGQDLVDCLIVTPVGK